MTKYYIAIVSFLLLTNVAAINPKKDTEYKKHIIKLKKQKIKVATKEPRLSFSEIKLSTPE